MWLACPSGARRAQQNQSHGCPRRLEIRVAPLAGTFEGRLKPFCAPGMRCSLQLRIACDHLARTYMVTVSGSVPPWIAAGHRCDPDASNMHANADRWRLKTVSETVHGPSRSSGVSTQARRRLPGERRCDGRATVHAVVPAPRWPRSAQAPVGNSQKPRAIAVDAHGRSGAKPGLVPSRRAGRPVLHPATRPCPHGRAQRDGRAAEVMGQARASSTTFTTLGLV